MLDSIAGIAQMGDYRHFAEIMTKAMQGWGVLPEHTGYVEGKLISETGELIFDPDHAQFIIENESCGYFSGAPEERIELSEKVSVHAENERISLALLPGENGGEYLLTAMGNTGMDETTVEEGPEVMPGYHFNVVKMAGKLYADTLEGVINVKGAARLVALDPTGREICEVNGVQTENRTQFTLDGSIPSVNFVLKIAKRNS